MRPLGRVWEYCGNTQWNQHESYLKSCPNKNVVEDNLDCCSIKNFYTNLLRFGGDFLSGIIPF
jgi:hypothetical protein